MDRVPSDSGPNRRRSALSDLPGCPVGKTARPSSSQLARVHGFVYTMPWVFRLRLVRCQARRWCAGMGAPLYDDGSFNSCGAALSLNIHKLNREPRWEQYRRAHCGPSQKSGARKRLVRQTRPRCVPERQTIRRSRSSRRSLGQRPGGERAPFATSHTPLEPKCLTGMQRALAVVVLVGRAFDGASLAQVLARLGRGEERELNQCQGRAGADQQPGTRFHAGPTSQSRVGATPRSSAGPCWGLGVGGVPQGAAPTEFGPEALPRLEWQWAGKRRLASRMATGSLPRAVAWSHSHSRPLVGHPTLLGRRRLRQQAIEEPHPAIQPPGTSAPAHRNVQTLAAGFITGDGAWESPGVDQLATKVGCTRISGATCTHEYVWAINSRLDICY